MLRKRLRTRELGLLAGNKFPSPRRRERASKTVRSEKSPCPSLYVSVPDMVCDSADLVLEIKV